MKQVLYGVIQRCVVTQSSVLPHPLDLGSNPSLRLDLQSSAFVKEQGTSRASDQQPASHVRTVLALRAVVCSSRLPVCSRQRRYQVILVPYKKSLDLVSLNLCECASTEISVKGTLRSSLFH